MRGRALIFGNMNVLGTSEMDVLSADEVNTLSLLYVLSHTSCIFGLILLWEDIHLEVCHSYLLGSQWP